MAAVTASSNALGRGGDDDDGVLDVIWLPLGDPLTRGQHRLEHARLGAPPLQLPGWLAPSCAPRDCPARVRSPRSRRQPGRVLPTSRQPAQHRELDLRRHLRSTAGCQRRRSSPCPEPRTPAARLAPATASRIAAHRCVGVIVPGRQDQGTARRAPPRSECRPSETVVAAWHSVVP